jgi:hypothetical protein
MVCMERKYLGYLDPWYETRVLMVLGPMVRLPLEQVSEV